MRRARKRRARRGRRRNPRRRIRRRARRRNPRRRRRRGRRRNSWRNDRAGHRRAALKGWRRKKRTRRAKRRNPRRRRRYNRGRRRYGRRARRRNMGASVSLGSPRQAALAAYNPAVLKYVGVMGLGALGNEALFNQGVRRIPMIPDFLTEGPGSYATKLVSAGLLGWGVGKVMPRWGSAVFYGGVVQTVLSAMTTYVLPLVPGMSGMDDYLSVQNAREARPLGDYLTVQNAREARALGAPPDEGSELYVAEELAAIA